jgi:hypothetical protein
VVKGHCEEGADVVERLLYLGQTLQKHTFLPLLLLLRVWGVLLTWNATVRDPSNQHTHTL